MFSNFFFKSSFKKHVFKHFQNSVASCSKSNANDTTDVSENGKQHENLPSGPSLENIDSDCVAESSVSYSEQYNVLCNFASIEFQICSIFPTEELASGESCTIKYTTSNDITKY
ncbi:uncharacterized protein LOC124421136 [Lucilia cuprina]|uniref:uncharacterized protein LOC124421136 n=1 Tax=Lucilia cuprina TaxID=7375 RepID=UPI001F053906|nr:uncharacterized protein LOC124421136 [Lucilia cuprina]